MRRGARQLIKTAMSATMDAAMDYVVEHRFPYLSWISSDELVFINAGYEEDPPMRLPLNETDEPNRYFIQLYHRTAAQVDLTGKRVLEISCGHGGGAAYVTRALDPASCTGLDINAAGIEFSQRRHHLPGLDFVQGDALALPFPDGSFDAVVNVQASFAYPSLPRFLDEVVRVLRPGGHLLYADRRRRADIPQWDTDLGGSALSCISEVDITGWVALGLERNVARINELSRFTPEFVVRRGCAKACRTLRSGEVSYRAFCLVAP